MTKLLRCAGVWLVAAVVPFHALTALYLDVRGPAHIHQEVAARVGHDHVHERASRHGHYGHVHDHLRAERHHHPATDPTVVGLETRAATHAALAPSGWSSTMIAALVTAPSNFSLPLAASSRHADLQPLAATLSFFRLERPPRALHA